jgi:hypothetical protein
MGAYARMAAGSMLSGKPALRPVMQEPGLQAQSAGMQVGQRGVRRRRRDKRCGEVGPLLEFCESGGFRDNDYRIGRAAALLQDMPFPARFDRDYLGRRCGGDAANRSDDVELLVSLTAPGGRTRWTAIAGSSTRNARERWRTGPEESSPQDEQCDQTAHMYADSSGLMHTQVREPRDSASRGTKSTVGRATRHTFAKASAWPQSAAVKPPKLMGRPHDSPTADAVWQYFLTCPSGRHTPAPGWRTCMTAHRHAGAHLDLGTQC